ncbi:MAG: DNA polymerase I [Bacteroidia bacterium]|nr:DNA polymerase I [Bacteroidia bacterium]
MNEQPRLFLLDGMALVYRAHFAFIQNPRKTSKGFDTSAIFGFCNSLLEVLQKEKPDYIGVAFDTHEPTFRHEQNAAYKAHRPDTPKEILDAIPYIHRILDAMGIPKLSVPGYEADDVIGTLAKKAAQQGIKTYMMTPDKDFCQLVEENIICYRPKRVGNEIEILDIQGVIDKFGVPPAQVPDVLGLWGDNVDNIKGIPGIGEKTAKKLIQEYGSVENLIQNADKLKGKLKENVIQYAQQGLESKQLATIRTDVPIELELDKLKASPFNQTELKAIFEELEFKTLSKRLFGEKENVQKDLFGNVVIPTSTKSKPKTQSISPSLFENTSSPLQKNTIHDTPHEYIIISDEQKLKELAYELSIQPAFCFDTETTSTYTHNCELVGVAFCFEKHKAYYVPCNAELPLKTIQKYLKPIFADETILKIGHNLKFDIQVLHWQGIPVKGHFFDTMLANYLIQPEMKHTMDMLSETYLNYVPISIDTLIGKGQKQISMAEVPIEKVAEYAAEDADVTWQLYLHLSPKLHEKEVYSLFNEVEMPLMPVLAQMEIAGVLIDVEFLKQYSQVLEKEMEQLEKEIQDYVGIPFNLNSPRQLGEMLFEVLKLDKGEKTKKSGQYATGEEILEKLALKLDIEAAEQGKSIVNIPRKVLEYRELAKLKSTYIDALPELVNPKTNRVHTSFNQAVAVTGRLSSNQPNLQNIPIRTEKGKEIRKAFIAPEGYVLLSADYSQIELRIMASMSEDESLIQAFLEGQDIHASTASKIFNVDIDKVTPDMRRKAKTVNFGIIYGISAHGLSERLGIPRKEAAQIIESYFTQYPKVKAFMDAMVNYAREHGYVQTLLGRKRYLPDILSATPAVRNFAERNAINTPIQGTAADMIKKAMINIAAALKSYQTKMLLQVHDELLFEVPEHEVDIVKPIIVREMKDALQLKVPVEVSVGIGKNWLEAH